MITTQKLVTSTSSDSELQNVPLKEISADTNGVDGPSVDARNKYSTCTCQMHCNAFGQVKTARNLKRPKPPLPPMKKKKDKPTHFSQCLIVKKQDKLETTKVCQFYKFIVHIHMAECKVIHDTTQ